MKSLDLVHDYKSQTALAADQLSKELSVDDLLAAWQERTISQRGVLSDGSEYQFHGLGCTVSRGDIDIDFDFGPGGRADGFDAWRLWRFAKQFPEKYPDFQQLTSVEQAVHSLRESDFAELGAPGDHLLYLRTK